MLVVERYLEDWKGSQSERLNQEQTQRGRVRKD